MTDAIPLKEGSAIAGAGGAFHGAAGHAERQRLAEQGPGVLEAHGWKKGATVYIEQRRFGEILDAAPGGGI